MFGYLDLQGYGVRAFCRVQLCIGSSIDVYLIRTCRLVWMTAWYVHVYIYIYRESYIFGTPPLT